MCARDAVEAAQTVPNDREVLPTNVYPAAYDVTFEPDLEKHTYDGTVHIDLDVKQDTTSIVLNTLELEIQSAEVHEGSTLVSSSPKVSEDKQLQRTTFAFDNSIRAGSKAKLSIKFTGILNDVLAGFYRASYTDKNGNKKYMATTQMEPTDARRAFPCFDEPALKSKFTVTLIADKGLTCLSNMDVKHEKEVDSKMSGGKKKAVTFNETPPMSTYLLAFIVGELNVVESNDFRVPVRVYAPPDQDISNGKFSVDLAAKTLDFYEKTFDSPYPLPKCDMVAIPDFSAGAMENWGLITYRTVDVLLNEQTSGATMKQRVAETVQHELAHQWFGNLVTMDFWEGLWLNEGFATWMSWYSCDKFYPEWKVWQGYVTDDLQSALSLDSLRSSHPIEVPVKRADQVNEIFDAISYSKGSCVIRMVSKYLGEDIFMEGIRKYLKRHAYGNTLTNDLWTALSEVSGKEVEKVMGIWTRMIGYPVVTVEEDMSAKKVHLKQNRFLRTADVKPEEDKTLYPVFLGLRTSKGVDEEATLFERSATFDLPADDFFKLNGDQTGVYRVYYTPERLEKLGEAAKAGKLSVEDRAGLLADAGALSASGYQKTSGLLSLVKGFSTEPEYVVWDQLTTSLASVRGAWVFEDDATKDALKSFQRDVAAAKAHELGWEFQEGEEKIQQQFKALMFSSAGSAGDAKVVKAAQDMFAQFAKGDRAAINPNLRAGVYGIVLQNGGEEEWNILYNEFKTAKTSDERNTALRSLGRAKDPALIKRTLALTMGDEVRNQDIYMPIGGLRTHKEGIIALWESIKENWETLIVRLPPGLSMIGSIVQICTSGFTHQDQIADVKKFFAERSTKGFEQGLAQSIDSVTAKSNWIKRDRQNVEDWLKKEGYLK